MRREVTGQGVPAGWRQQQGRWVCARHGLARRACYRGAADFADLRKTARGGARRLRMRCGWLRISAGAAHRLRWFLGS